MQAIQRKHRLISRHHVVENDLLHDQSFDLLFSERTPEVPRVPDLKRFFTAKTLDQLIAEQGTFPVYDLSVFAGAIPDEDMDEFIADIYRTRA